MISREPSETGQRVLCVLDTPAGGSSAVTQVLFGSGSPPLSRIPSDAPAKEAVRPEQTDPLTRINDAILARLGGSWHEPPAFPEGWHLRPEMGDLRSEASALILRESGHARPWCLNDPRVALTLPFWQALLPEMSFLIWIRNPLDAVALQRSHGFGPAKATTLWLAYSAAAIVGSAGRRHLVIWHEDFLSNIQETIGRCAKFANLHVPADAANITGTLDENRQKTVGTVEDAPDADTIDPIARLFHAVLSREQGAQHFSEQLVEAARAATIAFQRASQSEREVSSGRQTAVRQDLVINGLQQHARDLEQNAVTARRELARLTSSASFRIVERIRDTSYRAAPPGTIRGRAVSFAFRRLREGRRARLVNRVRFSLLLPVDDAASDELILTIRSVLHQSDRGWQLILTGPPTADVRDILPADPRVLVMPAGGGDGAARLNAALNRARGVFVGVLAAGDELTPDALRTMRRATKGRRVDVVYSDEEARPTIDSPASVIAKPDWSPELLLAYPYTGRLCLFRTRIVGQLGGWHSSTLAAEDYELVLAAGRHDLRIGRVMHTLYRRARALGAVMRSEAALEARKAALEAHFAASGVRASVAAEEGPAGLRVRWSHETAPLVSIVIATRDRLNLLRTCIESIEARTQYRPYEIVIVDNGSVEPDTLDYLETCGHQVVRCAGPFNFSRINNVGAREASGEFVVFLNNDTEVITPDWLEAMIEWAQQPAIACVGAKLLFGDGRVQHAGVVLHDGSAYHNGYGMRVGMANWFDIELVRNFSAVTAACLMIRRELFLSVGGFDESFPVAYNDVEFCVRLRRCGYRHVYTPYAVLNHHESASRAPGVADAEGKQLRAVIGRLLWHDPYCPRTQQLAPTRWLSHTRGARAVNRVIRVTTRGVNVVRGSIWKRRSFQALDVKHTLDATATDSIRWIDGVTIAGEFRIGLFMHPVASRTFLVTVPPHGRFHAWLALQPEVWDKNKTGATFRITVAAANVRTRTRQWTINPHRIVRHRRWVPVSLSLSRFAGQQVDLTLATMLPPGGKPAHAWALWGDPAILERRSMRTVIDKEWHLLRDLGVKGALARYNHLLRGQGTHLDIVYDAWIQQRLRAASEASHIEAVLRSLKRQPRISVITPVYNTEPVWLRRAVASVRAQTYPHWQLCLADDGSTRADTGEALDQVEALDGRITVVRSARNGGISAASNAALDRATGDFVALLDHDDELAPNALLEVARVLDAHPDADLVYSDEDKLEMDGRHAEPFFKPDWSPDYLRSSMYIGHLTAYRRSIVEEAGRFRSEFDGSQDYDLALRVTERTDRIHHIPKVLYHWRKIPGSAAGQVDAKPWGINAARRALRDHVGRLPIRATVHEDPGNGLWRVKYHIVGEPLVSIIIPTAGRITRIGGRTRDMPLACIRSIVERTAYRNYELVVVDDGWLSSELLEYLGTVPHRRIVYAPTAPFNFAAKINFSCRHASGQHLLLLNDDTEVISGEWLTAMLEFSQQRDIGAVGAKLLYPDGSLQHVGVVLGIGGGACHVLNGQPANSAGYFGSALVIRNYSAVTAACCMTRRNVFEELGGFDERFATDFNDVDYCLRVRAHGYRIVSTPFAQLYHYEGASFGSREHVVNPAEVSALSERWGSVIAADPFYNVNLTRSSLDYRLRLDAEEST